MRVCIYCHSIAPSIDGVCRRFTSILHELVNQGHEIILFTLEDHPEELPDDLVGICNIEWVSLEYYPDKKISAPSFRTLCTIWNGLRKYRPDVVHVTSDGLSQYFALAGMYYGIPVVGSFHTDLIDLLTVLNASHFQRWCVRTKEWVDGYALDSCATTSVSFQKKLEKQGLNCEHIIITGVDNEMFNPCKRSQKIRNELMFGDKNGFLCVYVGRISMEKRLDVLIEAIRKMDHVYLAIVGDGPAGDAYAAMHGKESRIYCKPQFLPHAELAEIYASADVHVSASVFETLGNTVLEAFACGVPVVVPLTQGFMDTVTDGTTGLFFEPGNADDAMQKLMRFQKDEKLRVKFGKAGESAMVERTSHAVVVDLIEWYKKGQAHKKNRSAIGVFVIFILLLLTVPFTISVYNSFLVLVNLFGPGSRPTRKKRPTGPAASVEAGAESAKSK